MSQAEPVAQFNEYELFTFPWDVVCYEDWRDCPREHKPNWTAIGERRDVEEVGHAGQGTEDDDTPSA